MKRIFLALAAISILSALHAQDFNLQFRGEVDYPYSCASIWGYVQDGYEYALVGTYQGVSIVDVTDPDNPDALFNVVHSGAASEWREIKTYGHYAYATNETGNGILIIDLQNLPDSYDQYQFIYDPPQGNTQTTGHTLWIDEQGRLFVFGGNYSSGYACFNLNSDPLNPTFLGKYSDHYIHDGFVRGDTLWASEIYDGQLEIIDVSDPNAPDAMAVFNTPGFFTHNSWPTSDNHYVFTTDEVNNSSLTSYDVSDFDNITELDRVQSNPGSQVIIHNVHLLNDQYAWTAYYKDGVVLFDVSHPDNMIEVASYDTDPGESGGDYGGTWGVYPYLPSGNIIASDLWDNGTSDGKLTVLTPTYVSACWLEGNITDSTTGAALNNVSVAVLTTSNSDLSNLSGDYKTGNGVAGTYTVQYSKSGYVAKSISTTLISGEVTTQDVQLVPSVLMSFSGQVLDAQTGNPIASANVFFDGGASGTYSPTSDANGNFSIASLQSGLYNVYAGKWAYRTKYISNDNVSPLSPPLTIYLDQGYYDDFFFNFNWLSLGGSSGTGKWTRGEPVGTWNYGDQYNPDQDVESDLGTQCYVTGNAGGSVWDSDVDDDVVTLSSPVFDLTNYNEPYISFYTWWIEGGQWGPGDDTLHFTLSNGTTTVTLLDLLSSDVEPAWKFHSFKVSDFIEPTSNMKLKLSTVDYQGNANWIEGGIDVFQVVDSMATGVEHDVMSDLTLNSFPNPFNIESLIHYDLKTNFDHAQIDIFDAIGNRMETHPLKNSAGQLTVGKNLPQGIYFANLIVNGKVTRVIKLVKTY